MTKTPYCIIAALMLLTKTAMATEYTNMSSSQNIRHQISLDIANHTLSDVQMVCAGIPPSSIYIEKTLPATSQMKHDVASFEPFELTCNAFDLLTGQSAMLNGRTALTVSSSAGAKAIQVSVSFN